jgi:hypothetical protein
LSWFLTLLLPFLPLRDHIFDYYLALPLIGLAMLAADAFSRAWSGRIPCCVVGVALVGFFLFESVLVARKSSWSWAYRSWNIRAMVMGVAEAHRLHPERAILLKDADDMLFWGAISQRCFLFLGFGNVYLAPGSESQITPHPELGDVNSFVMPAASVRRNLSEGRLTVCAWKAGHLEDVTGQYEASASDSAPVTSSQADRIDVGDPRNADRLDAAWYPIDQGFRWMPKRASVRMRISGDRAQTLHLSGYCPGAAVRNGALHMIVSVNAAAFPAVSIDKGDAPFEFDFPLPSGLPKEIEVTLEVDRTFRSPPDMRDLGLAFGVVEIR